VLIFNKNFDVIFICFHKMQKNRAFERVFFMKPAADAYWAFLASHTSAFGTLFSLPDVWFKLISGRYTVKFHMVYVWFMYSFHMFFV